MHIYISEGRSKVQLKQDKNISPTVYVRASATPASKVFKVGAVTRLSGSRFHIGMVEGKNDYFITNVRQNGTMNLIECPRVETPWGSGTEPPGATQSVAKIRKCAKY